MKLEEEGVVVVEGMRDARQTEQIVRERVNEREREKDEKEEDVSSLPLCPLSLSIRDWIQNSDVGAPSALARSRFVLNTAHREPQIRARGQIW